MPAVLDKQLYYVDTHTSMERLSKKAWSSLKRFNDFQMNTMLNKIIDQNDRLQHVRTHDHG